MTWFDYSMNFYKNADLADVANRKVYYSEKGQKTYILKSIKDRRDEPVLDLVNQGGQHASNYLLVPETREEYEVFKADLLRQIEDVAERVQCMEESGVERVNEKGFKIWKLMKKIKEETDDTKIKQLLSEIIKD